MIEVKVIMEIELRKMLLLFFCLVLIYFDLLCFGIGINFGYEVEWIRDEVC